MGQLGLSPFKSYGIDNEWPMLVPLNGHFLIDFHHISQHNIGIFLSKLGIQYTFNHWGMGPNFGTKLTSYFQQQNCLIYHCHLTHKRKHSRYSKMNLKLFSLSNNWQLICQKVIKCRKHKWKKDELNSHAKLNWLHKSINTWAGKTINPSK